MVKTTRVPGKSALATSKGEETRERILAAALELFREQGFDRTTMRDVATAAGVATGAAYYYFGSKEELVLAFYLETAEEMREALPPLLARSKSLRTRLATILEHKLTQFAPHRNFLSALFRTAVDPASPLSPFGADTTAIREEAVDWFRQALDGCDEKVPRDIAPYLPQLLWLYQMGIIMFWLFDRSPRQARTARLLEGTLDLFIRLLRLSSLPLMSSVRRPVVQLLRDLKEES